MNHPRFPLLKSPGDHHSIICFYKFIWDTSCKWNHVVSVLWFISLNMSPKSIHVGTNVIKISSPSSGLIIFHFITHLKKIHLSVSGHLVCFLVLVTVNNAVLNYKSDECRSHGKCSYHIYIKKDTRKLWRWWFCLLLWLWS